MTSIPRKNREESGWFISLKCLATGLVKSCLLMALLCSVIRSLRDRNVSPTYIFPHGHLIRYTTFLDLHVTKSLILTILSVTGWLNCLVFLVNWQFMQVPHLKLPWRWFIASLLFVTLGWYALTILSFIFLPLLKVTIVGSEKVLFKDESFWRICQCFKITLLIFLVLGVNAVQNTRLGFDFVDFFVCRSLLFKSTFVSAFTSQTSG